MCYCNPNVRTPYCQSFTCQNEAKRTNWGHVFHCKPVSNTPSIDWEEDKTNDSEVPHEVPHVIKVPSVSVTFPHKCPVCEGRTIVPAGFFTSTSLTWSASSTTEPCKVCDATGLVWGPDNENI